MSFKITLKLHFQCFLMSLIISFALQNLIINLLNGLMVDNIILNITSNIFLDILLFLTIISVLITMVHEIIHGLVYKLFGGKVRYGFKGLYAYTQETSGIAIHRTKFLSILLAPFTIISILTLVIPLNIGGIIFIINLLGSTGDIIIAFYLCKTNENSYIIDRKYGFDIVEGPPFN